MRKSYILVTIILGLFLFFINSKTVQANQAPEPPEVPQMTQAQMTQADYDPSMLVYIYTKKDMDSFDENRLPQYMKDIIAKFPKPGPDAKPIDKLRHSLKLFEYMTNRYSNEHPYYIGGQGIKFQVIVNRDDFQDFERFEITLGDYSWKNGKIIQMKGIREVEISQEDFDNLKYTWANHIAEGAEYLTYDKYADLRKKQVKIIEANFRENEILGESESLEEQMKTLSGPIPADELLFLAPKFTFADFAPKQVFIQSMQVNRGFILGMCLLEADIVYYDPSTLIFDYFQYNDVVLHEMVHNNSYLQNLIGGTYFDLEIQTSFSERYNSGFKYLFHGYLRGLNKNGKIIFNFDADRARREMIIEKGGVHSVFFDEDAVNKYIPMAAKVKKDMGRSIIDRFMPELYLHPIFFGCVGDELYNKHGSLYLQLNTDFAFSHLNGHVETRKQLNKYRGVIEDVYKEAINRTKRQKAKDEAKSKEGKSIQEIKDAIRTFLPIARQYAKIRGWNTTNDYNLLKQFYSFWSNGLLSLPQVLTYDTFRGKDLEMDMIINPDDFYMKQLIKEVSRHENK